MFKKNPFFFNEVKNYKVFGKFDYKSNKYFKISKKKQINKEILFISGPSRSGNHLLLSLLDSINGYHNIPGEDDFLKIFFTKFGFNKKNEIKKYLVNPYNYLINNSTYSYKTFKLKTFNKWKEFDKILKNNKKHYPAAGQKGNIQYFVDYPFFSLETSLGFNYQNYDKLILSKKKELKKYDNILDIFELYVTAFNSFFNKKKLKLKYCASGIRRELFYMMEANQKSKTIIILRDFRTFYFSFTKSQFNNTNITKKNIDLAWQHWYHKCHDYLLLKKKFNNRCIVVKFDDLITSKNKKILKKICSFLNVKFSKNMLIPTINNVKVFPNSSHKFNIKRFSENRKLKFNILEERYIPKKIIYNQIMNKINFDKI